MDDQCSPSGGTTMRIWTRGGAPRDRKSTRPNSSHGYISYAVFCLKKKNLLGCLRHGLLVRTDIILHYVDTLRRCYSHLVRRDLYFLLLVAVLITDLCYMALVDTP